MMPSVVAAPRAFARVTGAFYLVTIACGLFAELSRDSLIVSMNATETVRHILAAESLYRFSAAADVFADCCYVVVTVFLYQLLRPVENTLSLVAAGFSLIGISIGAVAVTVQLAALYIAGDLPFLRAFGTNQLQALSYVAVHLHAQFYIIALTFFGCYCVLIGWLIYRSHFIPRVIGVLMILAGASYLLNSFAAIVSPAFANALPGALGFLSLLGEGSLTVWLLWAGVDAAAWSRADATSKRDSP